MIHRHALLVAATLLGVLAAELRAQGPSAADSAAFAAYQAAFQAAAGTSFGVEAVRTWDTLSAFVSPSHLATTLNAGLGAAEPAVGGRFPFQPVTDPESFLLKVPPAGDCGVSCDYDCAWYDVFCHGEEVACRAADALAKTGCFAWNVTAEALNSVFGGGVGRVSFRETRAGAVLSPTQVSLTLSPDLHSASVTAPFTARVRLETTVQLNIAAFGLFPVCDASYPVGPFDVEVTKTEAPIVAEWEVVQEGDSVALTLLFMGAEVRVDYGLGPVYTAILTHPENYLRCPIQGLILPALAAVDVFKSGWQWTGTLGENRRAELSLGSLKLTLPGEPRPRPIRVVSTSRALGLVARSDQ